MVVLAEGAKCEAIENTRSEGFRICCKLLLLGGSGPFVLEGEKKKKENKNKKRLLKMKGKNQ